jgi:hypothetical protein
MGQFDSGRPTRTSSAASLAGAALGGGQPGDAQVVANAIADGESRAAEAPLPVGADAEMIGGPRNRCRTKILRVMRTALDFWD